MVAIVHQQLRQMPDPATGAPEAELELVVG
jgi:hypothetical protein